MTSKEANITKPGMLDIDLRDLVISGYQVQTVPSYDVYRHMQNHDPYICYLITNENGDMERLFIGDLEVERSATGVRYLTGYNSDTEEYVIYQNIRSGWHDHLVEISRFKTAEEAIIALESYNRGAGLDKFKRAIYLALNTYLHGTATLHQTIIQFISCAGYQDDPRLQELIQFGMVYGADQYKRELPQIMSAFLHNMARERPDTLYPAYSTLYDLMVKYDCFQKVKVEEGEMIDSHLYAGVISEIAAILH